HWEDVRQPHTIASTRLEGRIASGSAVRFTERTWLGLLSTVGGLSSREARAGRTCRAGCRTSSLPRTLPRRLSRQRPALSLEPITLTARSASPQSDSAPRNPDRAGAYSRAVADAAVAPHHQEAEQHREAERARSAAEREHRCRLGCIRRRDCRRCGRCRGWGRGRGTTLPAGTGA